MGEKNKYVRRQSAILVVGMSGRDQEETWKIREQKTQIEVSGAEKSSSARGVFF